jgi:hypothetical protein
MESFPKIIIIADLKTGENFNPAPQSAKEFILDNMPIWIESVIQPLRAGYGLQNVTVYAGLEDFDADRADGVGHFKVTTLAVLDRLVASEHTEEEGAASTDLERFASPVEQRIATGLVDHLLSLGYSLRVHDGEAFTSRRPSTDRVEVLAALASTGSDRVHLCTADGSVGWVWLIWGNEEDLVSDYSVSLANIVEPFLDALQK